MPNERHFISRLLQSRWVLAILMLLLIMSGLRLSNEIARRTKISSEINRLKEQITELKSEQESLTSLIDYLRTDAFVEEEARKKLNLQKPGERRVIISDPMLASTQLSNKNNNIQLWWSYFFESL